VVLLQGKVRRMRPSPFHKGSGPQAEAAEKPTMVHSSDSEVSFSAITTLQPK